MPLPLQNKAFYLDLNGYRRAPKLVDDIKKLGGSVEEFLSKDVRYVVTNRNELNQSSCKVSTHDVAISPLNSNLSGSVESPNADGSSFESQKLKSRGKSLLEKSIYTGKNLGSCDILSNAQKFGSKILSLSYTLKWIEKRKKMLKENLSHMKKKIPHFIVKKLKPPFIKIESLSRLNRPIFNESIKWPYLNFEENETKSPFSLKAYDVPKENIVNKERSKDKKRKRKKVCEICGISFNDLEQHLHNKRHRHLVDDLNRYKQLDDLVEQNLKRSSPLNELKQNLHFNHESTRETENTECKYSKRESFIFKIGMNNEVNMKVMSYNASYHEHDQPVTSICDVNLGFKESDTAYSDSRLPFLEANTNVTLSSSQIACNGIDLNATK